MNNIKKRLRVCLIVRFSKIAGTETHVWLLATHINTEDFEPHVLILEKGELGRRLRNRGINVTEIPNSRSIIHYLKVIRFFIKNRFDIVHCHSGGYAVLAAKFAGIKRIVYTKHGIGATDEELMCRSFGRKLRDILINMCVVRYIALTRYDKSIMTSILHVKDSIIQIVPNGIDPAIAERLKRTKKEYSTIGTVGRLAVQKGTEYLIKAVPTITDKYSNLKVLIAGSGNEEESLITLAKRLGISEKISFLGHVNDPLGVINKMDVFILPSVWEGFPYVLLEAMLLKKPIVATNIFGINEIIHNGESGILIDPRCPDSIADAVISILSDMEKSRYLGDSAYARLLGNYTLDITVTRIEKLYNSLRKKEKHN